MSTSEHAMTLRDIDRLMDVAEKVKPPITSLLAAIPVFHPKHYDELKRLGLLPDLAIRATTE